MEQLHIHKSVNVAIEKVNSDDRLDKNFKSSLYKQLKIFFDRHISNLAGHFQDLKWYDKVNRELSTA
jgi:hypothetical protein